MIIRIRVLERMTLIILIEVKALDITQQLLIKVKDQTMFLEEFLISQGLLTTICQVKQVF